MFALLASVTPSYRQLCVCEMQNSTRLITFLCGRSRQEAGVEITLWCCFVSLAELECVTCNIECVTCNSCVRGAFAVCLFHLLALLHIEHVFDVPLCLHTLCKSFLFVCRACARAYTHCVCVRACVRACVCVCRLFMCQMLHALTVVVFFCLWLPVTVYCPVCVLNIVFSFILHLV